MRLRSRLMLARDDRGAVAVEFAIVLSLLLVLVFGVIDFGRMFNAQITLSQVAREGARLEALGQPDPEGRAEATASDIHSSNTVDVTIIQPCPDEFDPSADAVVEASISFDFTTSLLGPFIGTRNLIAEGVMPCEA